LKGTIQELASGIGTVWAVQECNNPDNRPKVVCVIVKGESLSVMPDSCFVLVLPVGILATVVAIDEAVLLRFFQAEENIVL
jgi:hypothetical protein